MEPVRIPCPVSSSLWVESWRGPKNPHSLKHNAGGGPRVALAEAPKDLGLAVKQRRHVVHALRELPKVAARGRAGYRFQ